MSRVLSLFLSEEGADSERADTMTRYLRAELLELDIADATVQPSGEAPPGSRSGAVAVIGGLLSQPSPADQERLIELFISRHQAGTGEA
jgi:hypothetical protein